MSENMKAFVEKISKDEALASKLKGLKDPQQIIAFAKELGFELTLDDLKNKAEGMVELDDDALEVVAGGGMIGDIMSWIGSHSFG